MFLTSECGQSSWNTAWVMNQNQSHSLKMWTGLIRSVKENCERNWETIIAMYYHGPSYMRIEFWLFHVVIFLQWFDVLDIANSNGIVIHSGQATEGFDFFPSLQSKKLNKLPQEHWIKPNQLCCFQTTAMECDLILCFLQSKHQVCFVL